MKKIVALLLAPCIVLGQTNDLTAIFQAIDKRMDTIMRDWKTAGCAIGIVQKGKLVYAKGYGYRDIERKLPVTPGTLFAIGSDTKLFTATAAGLLVQRGLLQWDKPIKLAAPEIQFPSPELNASVTLRDMLSHRTGLMRHDRAFINSTASRKELFNRIRYMQTYAGLRERFIYNNFMYLAVGEIIEQKTGYTWEKLVTDSIFRPLGMSHTVLSQSEMEKSPDYAKPYRNDALAGTVKAIPFEKRLDNIAPAGAIISSINDLARWVTVQLGGGQLDGRQVLPKAVIDQTYRAATIQNGTITDKEISHEVYGMGRTMATYKQHFFAYHGGSIDGFKSNICLFPNDSLGIIVLTNSDNHWMQFFLPLEIADHILGLGHTPWHERMLELTRKNVVRSSQPNAVATSAPPLHPLADYVGIYKNDLFGNVSITADSGNLRILYNYYDGPLLHTRFDHFEGPDDFTVGKCKMQFITNEQGIVSKAILWIGPEEVLLNRRN